MTDNTSTTNTAAQIIDEFIQCADANRPHGKLIAQAKDWLAAHYATLTQQQGGEQEAGELLDIEVMRALFDSLPTSRAKDAYAAVKTYIDLCNENALRTKQPAASDCDRDRDTGRRRAAVEILLATGWQWQEGKWQPAASEGDVDWAKFPYSDAWCNGLSATLWECGMPNAQRQVEEIKDFVRAARANTSKQAAGEAVAFEEAPIWQPRDLRDVLQRKCSEWGTYWRAPDAHGVIVTVEQATELLADAIGVEVEITTPPRHPADEPHRNAGDSEANFIADGDRLNCPACGGSGHVDDAKAAEPVDLHKALGRVRARANEPGTVAQHGRAYADGLRSACNMLEGMPIVKSVFKAAPPTEQAPAFKGGHCVHRQQPGGCPLHNLHCRYPDCDLQPIEAPTEPLQMLPCPKR